MPRPQVKPAAGSASPERMADNFVKNLFDEYGSSHQTARAASWVGLIVCGIVHIEGTNWNNPRSRHMQFEYAGRSFKAMYNQAIGTGGGIEIVEALPNRRYGLPIACATNLAEAAMFHTHAARMFQEALGLPLTEWHDPAESVNGAATRAIATKKNARKRKQLKKRAQTA